MSVLVATYLVGSIVNRLSREIPNVEHHFLLYVGFVRVLRVGGRCFRNKWFRYTILSPVMSHTPLC